MRKSVFVKHVESLSETQLREELDRLYDALDDVKMYYKMELGSSQDRAKLYEGARKKISDKFKTKSYRKPRRPRIQKLNLLVKDLEKSAVFPHELIDVYLHIVETAVDFMVDYNYSSKPVLNSTLKYFEKALEQIRLCRMKDEYNDRCAQIIRDARAVTTISPAMHNAFMTLYPEE